MIKLDYLRANWLGSTLALILALPSLSAEVDDRLVDPVALSSQAETLIYSDPNKSIELLSQALSTNPDFELEYRIKILLSDSYVQLDRLNESIALLQGLRLQVSDNVHANKKAQILSRLGEVYWYTGEIFRSIEFLEQSLNLYRASGSQRDVSSTLNNLGIMYRHLGDYELALNYFLNSLSVKQRLNDDAGAASTFNNIGVLYYYLGKYYEAIDYYNQSITGYEKLGDRINIADPLNNKGQALEQLGNHNEAIEYYQQSLIIEQETSDKRGQGYSHANIGAVLRKSNRMEEAKLHLARALQLAADSKSPMVETEVRLQMGLLNFGALLLDAAKVEFLSGLELAEKTAEKEKIREFHKYLAQVFEQAGDYKSALKHFRLFKQMSEELMDSDSKERLTRMEFKSKLEQREQEITLLRQENQIQALQIDNAQTEKYVVIGASVSGVVISLLAFAIFIHRKQLNRERDISIQLGQLEQLKSQFFSQTSSELLSPIKKISQLSRQLQRTGSTEGNHRQQLEALEGFTGKLNLMIRNLLDFSAEKNNKLNLRLSQVSLSDLIYQVIEVKQLDFDASKMSFKVQLTQDDYVIECDSERIRQVLFNTVNYLSTHMTSGIIGIQAAEIEGFVMVRVSNLALSKEPSNHQPQSYSVTPDDGFELNLASSIISLHDGELWLEHYENGYTICFTLPILSSNT